MVFTQGLAISVAEGVSEFLVWVLVGVTERVQNEVKAPIGTQEIQPLPFHLYFAGAIEECLLTGPARPNLQWQRASWSSTRSAQGPEESQTQRVLRAGDCGFSVMSLGCGDNYARADSTDIDVSFHVIIDLVESFEFEGGYGIPELAQFLTLETRITYRT